MSKGSQKSILFRYDALEQPALDEWLNNQSNRTQSIIFGLGLVIASSDPKTDIVKDVLNSAMNDDSINLGDIQLTIDTEDHRNELEGGNV